MYVTVRRVVDPRKGIVLAATALGELRLRWRDTPVPSSGAFDVELTIPAVLEWGREIWRAADGEPPNRPPNGQRLSGVLLGLDERDVATIRTADGHLRVVTFGDPPLGTVDEPVELETLDLDAYPVNY